MRSLRKPILALLVVVCTALAACEGDKEHVADAISDADSIAFMRSRGISTLISDSGVIRYKLIAEEWDIYTNTNPPTWKFMKGLFMERFDEHMHIDLYVEADTAYLHNQRIWELRGRVAIRNVQGTLFRTEELFWDMDEHVMWSPQFMRIVTPERELQGTSFRSNEQMTEYSVDNSVGAFPISDTQDTDHSTPDPQAAPTDTAAAVQATTPTTRTPRTKPAESSQAPHWK
ncbi:MAG: LPS export ABC transporter periplasmic protein LptC [Bacteroidaceae bacterium]|nr:LPS export ABC transporter periplasmic protein LptC [Bacteroidaceae bacterium]